MLIVCPSCSSRYNIDDAKIGVDGRKVRCASCSTQWHVTREPALATVAADEVSAMPVAARMQDAPQPVAPVLPPEPEPEADPFDDEAMAREWAAAERAADETSETGGLTADKVRAIDAGDHLPDVAAAEESESDDRRAASAAALGAAAAAVTARLPWWRRLFRRRSAPVTPPAKAVDAQSLPVAETARPVKPAPTQRKAKPAKVRQPFKLPSVPATPFVAALAGFVLLGGIYWQREALVRLLPSSAPAFALAGAPVNLTGLVFADIRSTVHAESNGRFLVIEGQIRSEARDTVNVPLIELNLRGVDGRTVYTWTTDPPRRALKPGESLHFRTRLATPPEGVRDVEVRFSDKARSASARN